MDALNFWRAIFDISLRQAKTYNDTYTINRAKVGLWLVDEAESNPRAVLRFLQLMEMYMLEIIHHLRHHDDPPDGLPSSDPSDDFPPSDPPMYFN